FTVSDRTFNRAIGGEPKEVRKRRILLWIDGRCKFHGHRYTFIAEYRGLSQLTKLVAILIQVFDEVEILRNAANDRLQYRQASRLSTSSISVRTNASVQSGRVPLRSSTPSREKSCGPGSRTGQLNNNSTSSVASAGSTTIHQPPMGGL